MATNMTDLVNSVYDQVKAAIANRKVNEKLVFDACLLSMRLVESAGTLSGDEKKEIVTQVVRRLVAEVKTDDETRQSLQLLVDLALPIFIDKIIAAENGILGIIKTKCCSGKQACRVTM